MPHSSGGGGHGGFHGGGFRGGGYRGGYRGHGGHVRNSRHNSESPLGITNNPVIKKEPFDGGHKYMYYRFKKPHYYYANFIPTIINDHNWKGILAGVLIINVIIYSLLFIFGDMYRNPKKLETNSSVHYIIDDQMNCLTKNRDRLEDALEDFYQKTGIVPAIVTDDILNIYNPYSIKDPKDVAYNKYLEMFNDESHWLIVYHRSASSPDLYHFEGMQGNDTDKILYQNLTREFNSTLEKYLDDTKFHTTGESFALAFEKLNSKVMVKGFNSKPLIMITSFIVVYTAFVVILEIPSIKDEKYKKSHKVEEDMKETTCMFCGGIYLPDISPDCPFCKDKDEL